MFQKITSEWSLSLPLKELNRREKEEDTERYQLIDMIKYAWEIFLHKRTGKFYLVDTLLLDVNMPFNDKVLRNIVAFYWISLLSQEIEHTLYWLGRLNFCMIAITLVEPSDFCSFSQKDIKVTVWQAIFSTTH